MPRVPGPPPRTGWSGNVQIGNIMFTLETYLFTCGPVDPTTPDFPK